MTEMTSPTLSGMNDTRDVAGKTVFLPHGDNPVTKELAEFINNDIRATGWSRADY